ncbi:hypothetical protein ASPZODRAFT_153944 [Penicilliopsis zonata CBS 506.65]|uniref:Methyltransferase domain-containing protein n=1 Tax=Penicilliopsis zonata CBS 506.65 TaxID=1073090 RepID=A0A1L9S9V6_9EURO|nr:hypothetical protein ASPZODRAFT_153944 [Penicilliopsis zonata CBS 506.65]OJJ43960.1 hypothetical protein ASPZODRAFT_153944 [Penicilliopsis zonata CBS 506.65]
MASSSSRRTHTKITGAPDYDSPGYWDQKFATGQDVGEWLNPGDVLIEAAASDLDRRNVSRPRALHLGPGISKLGTKLGECFAERGWLGSNIVNVDFSAEAVRLGQQAEREKQAKEAMHWICADLRSWTDVSQLAEFAPFDLILDKSTSDAIATSAPQAISTDEVICPTIHEIMNKNHGGPVKLSPVELLALHLVPLTQRGSTWFCLSYSGVRFDNLPHLAAYWTLTGRVPVPAPAGQLTSSANTPEVFHWLYILQRNNTV